jgi:TM2 domain-containing membrane protein YozV
MAEIEDTAIEKSSPEVHLPTRSKLIAYLLLIPGLLYGLHRFYVGKWRTGILIPIANVFTGFVAVAVVGEEGADEVIGLFVYVWGAILVADGWFLRRWVAEFNQKQITEYELHPERFHIEDADHIAPWARGRAKKEKLGFFASRIRLLRNYFFFLFLPMFTGFAASQTHSVELLMIPIVVLVAIGLIGSLDKTLTRHPTVMEIPGVGQSLERVAAMRALYWNKEPSVFGAFKGLFFRGLKEYKVYWVIASVVMATVIINGILSYEVNTDHIETLMAVQIVGWTAFISAIAVLINLIPITALSFHYSLSGKTTRLGFMTVVAISATILGYLGNEKRLDGSNLEPSMLSAARIHERMKDTEYKSLVKAKMTFFLGHYMDFPIRQHEAFIDEDGNYVDEAGKPLDDANNPIDEATMGKVFRELVGGIAPDDEKEAFGVIVEDRWIAIVYHHNSGQCRISSTDATLGSYRQIEPVIPDPEVAVSSGPLDILAVGYRPTEENLEKEIEGLAKGGMSQLQIVRYMDEQIAFFNNKEMGSELLEAYILPGCRMLIDDHNF